ncbi:uncharacterized protein Dwil_GK16048 [Drosophila willistoni]|uniref:DHHA2 domain-containing protein n=1 Tax=Drosophila willistoni TaxID=7260 RepID=B4NQ14_DROWI|nr:exopolyphosphatase PRUNE1 [Drosophila willistoni]EDW86239.1 uncharacterized protein Dwil_GK16048 [Drosophila willistoni]
MGFLRFVQQTRSTLGRYLSSPAPTVERTLNLVLGNESCDLDSAISALTLAFIYSQRQQQNDYVPVLNIPRMEYPLKTEVGYLLDKCGINQSMLVFRDDLPEQLDQRVRVILVDHHISELASLVKEIYDHRPLDKDNPALKSLPKDAIVHLEPELGSCATLIGECYLAEEQPQSADVSRLLHATIVLDTINFSPAAKRFSHRDLVMVQNLEQKLNQQIDRQLLFDELRAARADISQLSLVQVLRKDMKIVHTARQQVPMAGLPLLARDFVARDGAEEAVREFGRGSDLVCILGMYVLPDDGQVQRDVALISLTPESQLIKRLQQTLVEHANPKLGLFPYDNDIKFMNGCFLSQRNVQATRKHILPVVRQVLLDWEETCNC